MDKSTISERTLATIKLDGTEGRGELFVRDGQLWCRDAATGKEQDTGLTRGIETEEQAARDIHALYRAGAWELEWVEG